MNRKTLIRIIALLLILALFASFVPAIVLA